MPKFLTNEDPLTTHKPPFFFVNFYILFIYLESAKDLSRDEQHGAKANPPARDRIAPLAGPTPVTLRNSLLFLWTARTNYVLNIDLFPPSFYLILWKYKTPARSFISETGRGSRPPAVQLLCGLVLAGADELFRRTFCCWKTTPLLGRASGRLRSRGWFFASWVDEETKASGRIWKFAKLSGTSWVTSSFKPDFKISQLGNILLRKLVVYLSIFSTI